MSQKSHLVQPEYLSCTFIVDTLSGVEDKGNLCGRVTKGFGKIRIEGEGMRPAKVREDVNRKIRIVKFRTWAIMVTDGRDSTYQIAYRSPPQPRLPRNLAVQGNHICMSLMDLIAPLLRIPVFSGINATAESGVE